VSTLRIEELTSSGSKQPRSVTLTGAALPLMGAEWGVENNVTTTWYPGNGDEASQQTLGPREMPSAWGGHWSQVMLSQADSAAFAVDERGTQSGIADPSALFDFIEDIVRAGQRLRVTYSRDDPSGLTPGVRKVREGRVKTFKGRLGYAQDIDWTINFVWASRGKVTSPTVATRDPSIKDASAAIQAKLAAFLSRFNQPVVPSSLTLGQLAKLASAPSAYVNALVRSADQIANDISQAVDIATTLATIPATVANQALNFTQDAINQANQMVQQLGQIPCEYLAVKSNASDVIVAAQSFGQTSDAAKEISDTAQTFYDQFGANARAMPGQSQLGSRQSASSVSDLLDVYRTKTGDTPQNLSMRYYATPDHGVDILRANQMPWYQPAFAAGTLLVIPTLSATGAGLQA
jgi:phage tail protein X